MTNNSQVKSKGLNMVKKELLPFVGVAKLISKAVGPDCEVILHDLSIPQHSVVHVENNAVTGRKVGDSFGHLVQKAFELSGSDDVFANYYYRKNGRLIRSSSLLIKDSCSKIVGALCINIDSTAQEEQLKNTRRLLPGYDERGDFRDIWPHAEAMVEEDSVETSKLTVLGLVNHLIDSAVKESLSDGDVLSREKRLEILRFLDSQHVFLMKGAMDRVAERLGVAKVTIYSDLDALRAQQNASTK